MLSNFPLATSRFHEKTHNSYEDLLLHLSHHFPPMPNPVTKS
jgi:hypothetical protein